MFVNCEQQNKLKGFIILAGEKEAGSGLIDFAWWSIGLIIQFNKALSHFTHHNVFITLLLGSKAEMVLVEQPCLYQNKNV